MFKFRIDFKNKSTFQEDWLYLHVKDKAQVVPAFYKNYPPDHFTLLGIQDFKEIQEPKQGHYDYSFGMALIALKKGKKVARKGWNGKGMWLTIVTPEEFTSFPAATFSIGSTLNDYELQPFIAMKTADETMVPWLASQTDMLAEDWEVVA